ncbi:hypothetical protein ACOMHN_039269 [Nucella lapillus]
MKQNTATLIITVVVGAIGLGAGFIIGYLLTAPYFERNSGGELDAQYKQRYLHELQAIEAAENATLAEVLERCGKTVREDPAIKNFLISGEVSACQAAECRVDLPRAYVVYKLDRYKINIDGQLNERAWTEVAWTEDFVDIGGEDLPAPRFESRVKLRWDDRNLYIGAYLQELAVWANKTLHDSTIYQDNSFQIVLDTEQSNHKYKEISINAMGTVADTMLTRPYMDDGEPLVFWESEAERAVYIEGPLNDPSSRNKFWTVEMAIPFKQLYEGINRSSRHPTDRETWRANFARSEWQTEIQGGKYLKQLNSDADWWVWQSPRVANIHIPDKWGLLQFHDSPVNSSTFQTEDSWITTNALLDVYRAQQAYKAVTGRYTDKKDRLNLPPYVLSYRCLRDLDIDLDWSGFKVTARPAEASQEDAGHIRTDRLLWFGKMEESFYRR